MTPFVCVSISIYLRSFQMSSLLYVCVRFFFFFFSSVLSSRLSALDSRQGAFLKTNVGRNKAVGKRRHCGRTESLSHRSRECEGRKTRAGCWWNSGGRRFQDWGLRKSSSGGCEAAPSAASIKTAVKNE